MKKIIEKLKQKPAHIRDKIAITIGLVVLGVIAVFWVTSLSTIYMSPETKTSFKESISPFKMLGASVRDALGRTSAELDAIDPANKDKQAGEGSSVSVDDHGVVILGDQGGSDSNSNQ